ncbi:MAG: hypothetical protein ACXV2E_06340 [Halobacteriota archaeon]
MRPVVFSICDQRRAVARNGAIPPSSVCHPREGAAPNRETASRTQQDGIIGRNTNTIACDYGDENDSDRLDPTNPIAEEPFQVLYSSGAVMP